MIKYKSFIFLFSGLLCTGLTQSLQAVENEDFENLPTYVRENIYEQADTETLLSLGRVSKKISQEINESTLWKNRLSPEEQEVAQKYNIPFKRFKIYGLKDPVMLIIENQLPLTTNFQVSYLYGETQDMGEAGHFKPSRTLNPIGIENNKYLLIRKNFFTAAGDDPNSLENIQICFRVDDEFITAHKFSYTPAVLGVRHGYTPMMIV
jgi:hypothetical protein